MVKLLLLVLLVATFVAALRRPWIGVLAGYLFILLGPQFIWWWQFEGLRPFLMIAVPTLVGVAYGVMTRRIPLAPIRGKIPFYIGLWWLFTIISYYFGAYMDQAIAGGWRLHLREFDALNKSFIFFFLAVLCIDDIKKIKYLFFIMVVSVGYLTFWANMQYLDGNYYLVHQGRLSGPVRPGGSSIYNDENYFAMIFVTGLPFVFYMGLWLKNKVYRIALWLVIPFGWHAVFLTGSRGGLIGLGVSTIVMAWGTKKAWLGILLIPALVIAYQWQGGSIMQQRSETISSYDEDASAMARFEAWGAAIGMIKEHPITGVGTSVFRVAFPSFSDASPREAHSTIFEICAENGLVAGFAWIMVILYTAIGPWRRREQRAQHGSSDDYSFDNYAMGALTAAVAGYAVCSMFLSLGGFEGLLYLALLGHCLLRR